MPMNEDVRGEGEMHASSAARGRPDAGAAPTGDRCAPVGSETSRQVGARRCRSATQSEEQDSCVESVDARCNSLEYKILDLYRYKL